MASKDFTELSVFGLDKRTNNDVESYHYQFNTLVEVKHPGAFDFADCVNEMLFNYCNEFDKLIAIPGVPIVRPFCSNTFEFFHFNSFFLFAINIFSHIVLMHLRYILSIIPRFESHNLSLHAGHVIMQHAYVP